VAISVLIYGCEFWTLSKQQSNGTETGKMSFLRTVG